VISGCFDSNRQSHSLEFKHDGLRYGSALLLGASGNFSPLRPFRPIGIVKACPQ
jgi:hypothetical protein